MLNLASNEEQLDFSDVLIAQNKSAINSRKDVDIEVLFDYTDIYGVKHEFKGVPIMAANMSSCGLISFAEKLVKYHYFCALEKHIPAKEIIEFFERLTIDAKVDGLDAAAYRSLVFVSIGIKESISELRKIDARFPLWGINFDVPNAAIPAAINRVKELRKIFPCAFISAKTVNDIESAKQLYWAGADMVGGPTGCGSACLTRLKTGVGRPALSTIAEIANDEFLMVHNKSFMCDGGIQNVGDFCKAFVAGADFVMSGSLFSRCKEADDGKCIEINGKKYKTYVGMSSHYAQKNIFKSSQEEMAYRTSEGREKLLLCSGTLGELIADINGGLRSCGTYIGASHLNEFPSKGKFYKVRRQLNMSIANEPDL